MKIFRPPSPPAALAGSSTALVELGRGWRVLAIAFSEYSNLCESDWQDRLAHAETVPCLADLVGAGVDAIAILSPEVAALFPASAAGVFADVTPEDSWVTVLLPWQEPPQRSIRADGAAQSFVCSATVFSHLLKAAPAGKIEGLCFRLLDAILNASVEVKRLRVKQLPLPPDAPSPATLGSSAALIMAHRGPKRFLTAALGSMTRAAGSSRVKLRVGLDVEDPGDYQDVVEAFPDAEFHAVEGAPVGPYVIRQGLIDRSSEDLLVFHDSDDISCHDRVIRQAAEIASRNVEVVGSHELRVDELAGEVKVFRFPLDATAALALPGSTEGNDCSNEPLLHPTVTMVRRGFVQAGGFSTDRKIANDTQFMLRAYFSLRMRNVDGFLYIRRRHAHALTVEKETALGTPLRHYLGTTWGADFEAVKSGKARLEETSLWPRLSPVPHRFTRLLARQKENWKRRA